MRTPGLGVSFAMLGDGRVDGYVAPSDAPAEPISALRGETHRGADGLPVAARYVIDHELEVDVEVLRTDADSRSSEKAARSGADPGRCVATTRARRAVPASVASEMAGRAGSIPGRNAA